MEPLDTEGRVSDPDGLDSIRDGVKDFERYISRTGECEFLEMDAVSEEVLRAFEQGRIESMGVDGEMKRSNVVGEVRATSQGVEN